MADTLFDLAAERLEHHTSLDRLEARGTLRLALKTAELNAKSVTAGALCMVFEMVMPDELEKRGVKDATVVCRAVIDDLVNSPALVELASSTDLDDIFARIEGD